MLELKDFLGGMGPKVFFSKYFDKKPLLIRGAYKGAKDIASFQDFFEMAEDENFESRIIQEQGDNRPWEVSEGPFKKSEYHSNRPCTLAVHSLNLYFEELYQFEKVLDVIPGWMFDDVMGVYSSEGGTMGAHYDNYNVFLLQGLGTRRWKIQLKPDLRCHDHFDIKLLQNFIADEEYILEPGDMLYLPPQVAHHGISLSESTSVSIGFRSFNHQNLVQSYLAKTLEEYDSEKFMRSPENLEEGEKGSKINLSSLESMHKLMRSALINKKEINLWFGCYITEPRYPMTPSEKNIEGEEIEKAIFDKKEIFKDSFTKFSIIVEDSLTLLFVNGKAYHVKKKTCERIVERLEGPAYSKLEFGVEKASQEELEVLIDLFNKGALFF